MEEGNADLSPGRLATDRCQQKSAVRNAGCFDFGPEIEHGNLEVSAKKGEVGQKLHEIATRGVEIVVSIRSSVYNGP